MNFWFGFNLMVCRFPKSNIHEYDYNKLILDIFSAACDCGRSPWGERDEDILRLRDNFQFCSKGFFF